MDKTPIGVSCLGAMANGWHPKKASFEGGFIKDMKFEKARFEAFIAQARFYGASFWRVFPYETKWIKCWQDMFSPYQWDEVQGAWNLDTHNEPYFAVLDQMIATAGRNGIRSIFSLFDNCQNHCAPGSNRNEKMAPWLWNTQGIRLYTNSTFYSKRWTQKIGRRYGNRIDYELCNELTVEKSNVAEVSNWMAQMADCLLRMGVLPERIHWGAEPIGDWNGDKFEIDKQRDLITVASRILSRMPDPDHPGKTYNDFRVQDRILCTIHNIGIYPEDDTDEDIAVQCWGNNRTRNALVSDDGQKVGKSKLNCEEDGTWRRGDYKQTYDTTLYFLKNSAGKSLKWYIESLPSNNALPAWRDNIKAMAQACFDYYGVWPENWGKPFVPELEPITPDPVTPPIPDDGVVESEPCTLWYHLKRLNFRAAWEHLLGKHSGV